LSDAVKKGDISSQKTDFDNAINGLKIKAEDITTNFNEKTVKTPDPDSSTDLVKTIITVYFIFRKA
jgi:hypothetical protein